MIYKTFISYAGADSNTAQLIHDSLGRINLILPYKAENYPNFAEEFKQRIQREIIDSVFMIALLTENGKNSQFVNQEIGFAKAVKACNLQYKFNPKNKDLPIIIPISQKNVDLKGLITKDSDDILFLDNYPSLELVIADIILVLRAMIPKGLEDNSLTVNATCPYCFDEVKELGYLPESETLKALIKRNEKLTAACPKCKKVISLDARTLLPLNDKPEENKHTHVLI